MRFVQDPNLTKARVGLCLLGLLALPLLAGCGGGGGGSSSSPTPTPIPTPTPTPTPVPTPPPTTSLSTSVITATGLTATLAQNSSTVAVNGTLVYTLSLTNNTSSAILAPYTGTTPIPSVAVKVIGPNGVASYQPLPGGPPLNSESLAPGQSISTTQMATGFTTSGTYTATATFSDGTSTPPVAGPLTVTAQ